MEYPEITIHNSCATIASKYEDFVRTLGGCEVRSSTGENHTGGFSVGVTVGETLCFNVRPDFARTIVNPKITVTISLVDTSENDEVVFIERKRSMACAGWWWCIGRGNCCPLGLVFTRLKLVQVVEGLCSAVCEVQIVRKFLVLQST